MVIFGNMFESIEYKSSFQIIICGVPGKTMTRLAEPLSQ